MSSQRVCNIGLPRAVVSLGILWTLLPIAAAQTAPPLGTGTRVRIVIPARDSQPERYITGSLVRLAGDTVVVAPGGLGLAWARTVALDDGRRLEVVASSHGHGGKGAALGALIGGVTVGFVAGVTSHPCSGFCPVDKGTEALGGAFVGAAGGAIVGMLIGSSLRDETWVPVRTAGVRVALVPRGVGISLHF